MSTNALASNSSHGESSAVDGMPLASALSTRSHPPPPSAVAVSLVFAWRAMLKIKHVPMQLLDVTLFPVIVVVLFTFLFGGALEGSTDDYLQELLPGILVMAVCMITCYTGMALTADVTKGVFDRFRSMPIWRPAILSGMLLADTARYLMASTVVVVVGIALGFRPGGGPLGVVAAMALLLVFAFSLSWVWSAIGLKMQTPEMVMQTSINVLFSLILASNVFVDPGTMPGWVQGLVEANPISHVTTASRSLVHGSVDGGSIVFVLVCSAALVAVFGTLTMRLYNAER